METAELELSYTDVKAPFAGSIGRAHYSVGSYLGPTSGALATIVSQDPTYVVFPVSVRLLLDLRVPKRRFRPGCNAMHRNASQCNAMECNHLKA